MKTVITILIICLGAFISDSFSPSKPEIPHHGGRCTGSASCTACSNCSGCAHCAGGGGSCGVCGGGSSRKSTSSHGRSSKKSRARESSTSDYSRSGKSKKKDYSKAPKVFIEDVKVNINSNNNTFVSRQASTNVYEKPSLKSKVIEKISKNTPLINISKKDYWYKVKVQKSGNVGYIYYDNIK